MQTCLSMFQVKLMSTYLTKDEYKQLKEVPDPYFGGEEGFEKVSFQHSSMPWV